MTGRVNILIIRLSSIGDIILTTPLLRSLREHFPLATISFVIKERYADLLANCPHIDNLISFDSNRGFAELRKLKRKIRGLKPDILLDIHRNWRSFYLRAGIGAKYTGSYRKQILYRTCFVWFGLNLYRVIKPVYLRYYESAEKLGVTYDGQGTEISLPDECIGKVSNMLGSSGYAQGAPLAVICPGATFRNKEWPAEHFIETTNRLIRDHGIFVAILGGREDAGLCHRIVEETGGRAVSFAGRLNLPEAAALLRLSNLAVTNDSGLMHLAQSQKTPVVAIYGPTTRELGYFPFGENSKVIETSLPCRPCTHNGLNHCPRKHFRCMKEIKPDRVVDAAIQLIKNNIHR